MFKDQNEELRRLEEALLEEEADEQLLSEEAEEAPDFFEVPDDAIDRFYADSAEPYRAYNTDTTDTDLDEYSEDVWLGKPKTSPLVALVCILTTGILLVVLYLFLRYGGWL